MLVHCDNEAVVEVINSGSCRDPELMQLLRYLFFVLAHCDMTLRAVHIPGVENSQADAISRNNLKLFHLQNPQASPRPTPIPAAAVELIVNGRPDWTSQNWSQLFSTCMHQALPQLQAGHTGQGVSGT